MRRLSISALVAAALLVGIAAPAHAANYPSSWKDGFPPAKDIGATLGNYATAPAIDIGKFTRRWYVCSEVKARPAAYLATAQYAPTPLTQSVVQAQSRVYSSAAKAKSAFADIRARLSDCDGSRVEESEPGSDFKWRATTTSGTVPDLQSDGQTALFVYDRQTPTKGSSAKPASLGSEYIVLALSGDTVLVTTAAVSGASKLTAAQQSDVVSFAQNFLDTWTKANP